MNLVVLFLVSQMLSASLSTAEWLFDIFEQPWLHLDTDSLRSPPLLLGSESPGPPNQLRGYMENCDPNSKYNISWEPKDIDPHGPLDLFINYTAPADVDGGEYSWDVKYRFIHVIMKKEIPCAETSFWILTKGETISKIHRFPSVIRFKNFKGTFKVKFTAENKNHENLLCVKFTANVI